jgi:5-methylcytosine-specific restriction endonuclease McrA
MSNQAFTPPFREALWEAHNRKCLHCGRELLYTELRVDHLLPEYLQSDSDEREEILKLVGLPLDFDVLAKQNLAPSCGDCNDKKGTTILAAGSLAILVAKVRAKIPEVEKREADRKAAKELDSILRAVARAVDGDTFSVQDLKSRLDDLTPPTDLTLELAIKLGTDEEDYRTVELSRDVARDLRRRRITLTEVTAQIRRMLQDPTTKIDRRERSCYMIRGPGGLRVVFETWRKKIWISYAHIT